MNSCGKCICIDSQLNSLMHVDLYLVQRSYHTTLTTVNMFTEVVAHDVNAVFRHAALLRKDLHKKTLMHTIAAKGSGSERATGQGSTVKAIH